MSKKKDTFEIIGDRLIFNNKHIFRLNKLEEEFGFDFSKMENDKILKLLQDKLKVEKVEKDEIKN